MQKVTTIRKPVMDVLNRTIPTRKPIWMMRQAGRYLPEYQDIRRKTGSFLNLCYMPEYASEVTLQPIRRFDLDAAIIFADILLVPHALGQRVEFKPEEGPILEPITDTIELKKLNFQHFNETLNPVFETIHRTKSQIPEHITLIGFCGAPWTVASYMIEGKTSKTRSHARKILQHRLDNPKDEHTGWIDSLFNGLIDASVRYLCAQIKAGVHAIQIFDTWACDWAHNQSAFEKYCLNPINTIIAAVKKNDPHIPIIVYVRDLPLKKTMQFAKKNHVALSIGYQISPEEIACEINEKNIVIQGNLDPNILLKGGNPMYRAIDNILENFQTQNHIFNLGHGILPQTPIKHVNQMINHIRSNA